MVSDNKVFLCVHCLWVLIVLLYMVLLVILSTFEISRQISALLPSWKLHHSTVCCFVFNFSGYLVQSFSALG